MSDGGLSERWRIEPVIGESERQDGKWVLITNDDSLAVDDAADAYQRTSPPDDGMPVEATQEMFPDPPEGQLRLAHVEDHGFIPEQVEIVYFPFRWAFFRTELAEGGSF